MATPKSSQASSARSTRDSGSGAGACESAEAAQEVLACAEAAATAQSIAVLSTFVDPIDDNNGTASVCTRRKSASGIGRRASNALALCATATRDSDVETRDASDWESDVVDWFACDPVEASPSSPSDSSRSSTLRRAALLTSAKAGASSSGMTRAHALASIAWPVNCNVGRATTTRPAWLPSLSHPTLTTRAATPSNSASSPPNSGTIVPFASTRTSEKSSSHRRLLPPPLQCAWTASRATTATLASSIKSTASAALPQATGTTTGVACSSETSVKLRRALSLPLLLSAPFVSVDEPWRGGSARVQSVAAAATRQHERNSSANSG